MWKILLMGAIATSSITGWAKTAAHVKCLSAGDDAKVTFDGKLVISSIVDLPTGGFTVAGRRIIIDSVKSPAQLQTCRDWYIQMTSWTDSDNQDFYTYERRVRDWNTITVTQQNASIRMSCGIGSIVTEYDSIQSYIDEYRQKVVEIEAPRSGLPRNYDNHISGIETVSSPDCVINQL